MTTLNLVYPEKSDIKYKISTFPDGQQDITILLSKNYMENFWIPGQIQIRSRFNSWKSLELIVAANKALRRLGSKYISLYIPYLLGARSDRQFVKGGNSYLVDVIAPVINAQNFESVGVIDVHSDVAAACIKNLVHESTDVFYKSYFETKENYILVSPDAGSMKKIYKIADLIGYKDEIIVCSKYRDSEGKLSKTYVPYRMDHYSKDLIIIDDICDGGRTFINIAEEVLKIHPDRPGKIELVVTHGIFSAGFTELERYFNKIYCTNSVKDIDLSITVKEGFFKQFNVF